MSTIHPHQQLCSALDDDFSCNFSDDPIISSVIHHLRSILHNCQKTNKSPLPESVIVHCGKDAVWLLDQDARKGYELAEIKLRSVAKQNMIASPWCCLYTEAAFLLVTDIVATGLREILGHVENSAKQLSKSQPAVVKQQRSQTVFSTLDEMMTNVCDVLDRSMLLTGLLSASERAHDILKGLRCVAESVDAGVFDSKSIKQTRQVSQKWLLDEKLLTPSNLPSHIPVRPAETYPPIRAPIESLSLSGEDDLNDFTGYLGASHFNRNNRQGPLPVVVLGGMKHWPALGLWQNPAHLLQLTLGGRRIVPVEIGKSYTDSEWTQRLMTIREFVARYMLYEGVLPANDRGYFAQHSLFQQIPDFQNDILEPVLCYSDPPYPNFPGPESAELIKADSELTDDVQKNIWMGPAQTVSPAHTDPYHNIFAQVVGYKYFRLYPPSVKANLYPRGSESGIDMSNTSQVDIAHVMRAYEGWQGWDEADKMGNYNAERLRDEMNEDFPLLKGASYVETILEPGQMLFIPKGWIHYVRSLSPSIGVSFWWK
jgi:Cupin-like domain